MNLHGDELPVDATLIRALLVSQLPELAGLPLTPLPEQGSSNAMFRLGPDLLVRLPRQPGGSASIVTEARWAHVVGEQLPIEVPAVVAVGRPGHGYPESWSVVRWIEGEVAGSCGSSDVGSGGQPLALDLAAVVLALGRAEVPPAAVNDPLLRSYRSRAVSERDTDTRQDLRECRKLPGLDLDLARLDVVWETAMALPPGVPTQTWLHGDLFGENLLVRDGRLAAVLDLGVLAVGDPTVDLVVAWDVLDDAGREAFRVAVGVADDTWLRGRAWALCLAAMTLPYYWTTLPQRCASRVAVLDAVLRDASGA